jgi:hypothetical protein
LVGWRCGGRWVLRGDIDLGVMTVNLFAGGRIVGCVVDRHCDALEMRPVRRKYS